MDATRGEQTQAAKRGLSMPVNHRVRWLFPFLTWLVAAAMALVLTLSLPGSEAHATGPVATVSPAASTENVSVPVSFSSGSQDIWSPVTGGGDVSWDLINATWDAGDDVTKGDYIGEYP